MIHRSKLYKNIDVKLEISNLRENFLKIHNIYFSNLKTEFSDDFENNRLTLLNKIQVI